MRLRRVTFGFSGVALLSLVLNAILLAMILQAHGETVRIHERRQRAYLLTNGLQQEAEQLASLARSFATGGQARLLGYYDDILAVRAGAQRGPADFELATYWKDVIAGKRIHQRALDGAGVSMAARMRALEFESPELRALERVETVTAQVQQLDREAFAVVAGPGAPHAPRFEQAATLLNSARYNQLQAALADALAALSGASERRTREQMQAAQKRLDRLTSATLACLLCSLVLVLAAAWVLQRQVLRPIRQLSRAAQILARGDYSARVGGHGKLHQSFGVEELAALGNAFNGMAGAIEQDLYQRTAVQRELEQARQLSEDASRAKSMFLANMSHEIRTPMNAIIGMAYLAMQSGLPQRQHGYVSQVHSAATALLALINDILDFSKVEAGKMELSAAPFRLEQVLADVLALVQVRAREKGLELVLDLGERKLLDPGVMLMGDALRLGQVLTNLMSNAVKFTESGSVRLHAQLERREADGVSVRFTVRDTGIGMDAAQLGRLFREFSQADGSSTRKYGGTGLGLAISDKLVKLMGGRISADSRVGEGSRFTVVVHFGQVVSAAALPALPGVAALRVLVIDDLAATRLALQNLLRAAGVDGAIDVVTSLPAARARLEAAQQWQRPYGLILLDWELAQHDCAAWLAELANAGLAVPPIVPLTLEDPAGAEEAGAPPGLLGYLAKPVQPAALAALLARVSGTAAPPVRTAFPAPAGLCLQGLRVLLVEDQPTNRQLACELLALQGVDVETAAHGEAGLAMLEARGEAYFHAVLMDVQMPVMDGYEATRRLRRDPRFASLPVIAMTAHAMAEERARCSEAGMTGHLSKPVEPEALYATLARYCGGPLAFASQAMPESPDLATIAGLDITSGLRRAGGQQQLYRKLLADFTQDYGSAAATLSEQVASGRWNAAEQLAHALHGVAATLGANSVAAMAAQLESDCRAVDSARAAISLAVLVPALRRLLGALQVLTPQAMPFDAGGDAAGWPARLRSMLGACDSQALPLWLACRADAVRVLGRSTANRLNRALDTLDFDLALAVLNSATPQPEMS